jgi:RNA 2',3'-cyclic 3'-phosphodiesterase
MAPEIERQQTATLRTFVAIPLSQEVHTKLDDLQRQLKRRCPAGSVRWVVPESIHLTLHFLGDILPERVEPVRAALAAVARNAAPRPADPRLAFQVGGLGAFPNLSRPRVVWVGVQDPASRVALLHEAVGEALASVGFEPERRRFSPHLTLGRVKRQASAADVRTLGRVVAETESGTLGSVPVRAIIFFQSVLKPSGAVYTPLHTFSLTNAGCEAEPPEA